MRRIGKGFLLAITILVCLFTCLPNASAGVAKVLCVPWQGNPTLPHTAISGQAVELTAVIYGDASGGTYNYTWEFKDSSATPTVTGTITVPANGIYNLKVSHTYTEAVGAVFNTILTVGGIADTYKIVIGPNNNSSKVNIAIDKGLWFLHTSMTRTNGGSPSVRVGYWAENGYYVGATGAAVWAFEVQGHLLNVETNPLSPAEDPYVEDVQRGINYLLTRLQVQSPLSAQTYGNPDYNGNGVGLVCYYSSGHTNYENGIAMGAISGSGTPTATAATGSSPYVLGRTYKDIVQDMVEWYAWSQNDEANFPPNGSRGGWYYTANANYGAYYGDNSASQWAYIGLEAAQHNFGCVIPDWVKTQLAGYLHGQISYTNRGYVSYRSGPAGNSDFTQSNVCLTGGALVGMALAGQSTYDAVNGPGSFASDMNLVKPFLGAQWQGQTNRWSENWYGHRAYYTMYAIMKGFRLNGIQQLPGSPGTSDWYSDYVSVMIPDQKTDGHWYGAGWMDTGYVYSQMDTAFGVLILTPSVFSPPPVACFTAKPNPGYPNVDISFNPSCSYHSDPSKQIVLYEWDWDNDGVFDASSSTPDIVNHQWPSNGTYPVTLQVTDNTAPTPVKASTTIDVEITLPPHPPVSKAGGPYVVSSCPTDSLRLDGSASFDIDQGQSESGNPPFDAITSWSWDLGGAPWNYGDKTGSIVTLNAADLVTWFATPGSHDIGLKVTDNTLLAYPSSGQPNLSDQDFTTVNYYEGSICSLAARPKAGKVQLTWAYAGDFTYNIYRSTIGPNSGFQLIAANQATSYCTYLDTTVSVGTKYYYRIIRSDGHGSIVAAVTPTNR